MEVMNLLDDGPIAYSDGLALQERIHAEVSAEKRPDTLILLEHTSVYTGGKMSEMSDIADPSIELVETNRGGKITWHGPGQLIGYPIYRLPTPIDVVGYVRTVEDLLIDVVADFGVTGKRVDKRTGVWVGPPGVEQKMAAIGIRVADRTTMHGFALNVNNSLEPYRAIIACGIRDAGVTTLEAETQKAVTVAQAALGVGEKLRRYFP
jgi:lipoyl(octanoyl) transferase